MKTRKLWHCCRGIIYCNHEGQIKRSVFSPNECTFYLINELHEVKTARTMFPFNVKIFKRSIVNTFWNKFSFQVKTIIILNLKCSIISL